jgi:hypothetical protein
LSYYDAEMSDLKFRVEFLPGSRSGHWRWELYVEGDELPVGEGFTGGDEADLNAAIEEMKRLTLENYGKSTLEIDEPIKTPQFSAEGLHGVKLRFGSAEIGSEEETKEDAAKPSAANPRRFGVELFIIHPSLDPDEISRVLGLEAKVRSRVGDQRKTPNGKPLSGVYPDTRWRHSVRFAVSGQWFAREIVDLIDKLESQKAFLAKVMATGGSATIIIAFLGDGYFGDTIPATILGRIANLGLDFGIECFAARQS